MSASLYWRPTSLDEHHIDVGAPSSFVNKMTRAFGSYPWKLKGSDLERLRGLEAGNDGGAEKNPFTVLIEAIELDGGSRDIEVWPVY